MDEELPSETVPDVVDNRPLIERIVDKNWKTRNVAYENLKNELKEGADELFSEFGPLLSKMTSDANAGALDSGFDAALAFADVAPPSVSLQYADKLFANVVDKAFGGKTSTQTKGKALLFKLIEIDDPTLCTTFLLSKLADKKPKVPPMCLDVIKEGIGMFGLRTFPVKDIIKSLGAVLNGNNGPARESAMALCVEIYRWIGVAPLQSLLDSLRTAQKSEFDKIIEEKGEEWRSAGAPVPSLYLRKNRPAPGSEAAAATGSGGAAAGAGNSGKGPALGDGRDFVDEVDLTKKLKGTDFATLVAEEKWSEQLKGLQCVIEAIGPVPKIKPGCEVVGDILAVVKGFLRQGHVLLQVNSLKIVTLLADGLRGDFSGSVRPLTQSIVQKSKEKKLTGEVHACLLMVLHHCLAFDSLCEDVAEIIGSKKSPPHSRICMMEFFAAVCAELPAKVNADCLKPMAEAVIACTEDSDVKVRDTAAATLAAMAPLVKAKGRFAAEALKALQGLEQSAPRVYKKMQAAMEASSASAATSAAAPAAATAAGGGGEGQSSKSTASKKAAPSLDEEEGPVSGGGKSKMTCADILKKPTPASLAAAAATGGGGAAGSSGAAASKSASSLPPKKPSATASAAAAPASKKASGASAAAAAKDAAEDDNVEELALSADEAKEQLAALGVVGWEGSFQEKMSSSKWQDKVEALAELEAKITESKQGGLYSAALVKYLSTQTAGFKISNMNILKAVIQCCCAAAVNCGANRFNKPAAWELLKQFGDKLSDRKTKEVVEQLLTAFSENISPSFVLKRMRVVMDKIKLPLAHQCFLEWLKQAITDFGYTSFPVPLIGSLCSAEMDNKIAAVRVAAVEVMGQLYHQIGPRLQAIAISEDMKPALRQLLEAEFAKVGHDPTAAGKATRAVAGDEAGGGAAGGAAAAIPRQDLAALVDKNILVELNLVEGKNSWQNRKAAMEAVIAACERSGHYLEANKPTGEIVKLLKLRINDTQANLKPIAVAAIGHVIASLEPEAGNKVLKVVAGGLFSGLADNKKQMRDSTIAALHLAVTANKQPAESAPADPLLLGSLLPAVAEALVNVVGRQELLQWLVQVTSNGEGGGGLKNDCSELTPALVLCLQDKTAAVRSLAEQLLTLLMARALISRAALDKATRDLSPATKRALQPAIDRMMAAHGTANKKAAAAPAAAAAGGVPASSSHDEEPVPHHHTTTSTTATAEVAPAPVPASPGRRPAAAPQPSAAEPEVAVTAPAAAPRRSGLMAPKALNSSSSSRLSSDQPPHPTLTGGGGAAAAAHSESTAAHHQPPRLSHAPAGITTAVEEVPSPVPIAAHQKEQQQQGEGRWFLKKSAAGKTRRLEDFPRLNWPQPPEEPGEVEWISLKATWEPLVTADLAYLLFPTNKFGTLNQDSFVPAITELSSQLDCPHFSQHTDLVLRWCCYILSCRESPSGLLRVLILISDVFVAIRSDNSQPSGGALLHESEVLSILPHLIEKSGHKSERHRTAFKHAIATAGEIIAPNRITQLLLAGMQSVNKRSRTVAIEEIQRVVETAGVACLGRTGVRDIAAYLDSKESDLAGRNACLELLHCVYLALGSDFSRLMKLAGGGEEPLSERTLSMIEDRIKQKNRSGAASVGYGDVASPSPAKKPLSAAPTPAASAAVPPALAHPAAASSAAATPAHDKILQQIDEVIVGYNPILESPPASAGGGASFTSAAAAAPASPARTSSLPVFKSPVASKPSRQSLIPVSSPIAQEYESIYSEISKRVERLLSRPQAVPESDPLNEEAKDYLKMLHAIVTGEWSSERVPEDEAVLQTHCEALTRQLVRCIARSFDLPSPLTSRVPGAMLGVDVSLVAISLSTLFAIVKRGDLVPALGEQTLYEVFFECLLRICDPRILHPQTADPESQTSAGQIVTALNMVLVKLAQEARPSSVLSVLLRVMFQCIPASELLVRSETDCLPPGCTKPCSRLIIKVLTDETEKEAPHQGEGYDAKALLWTIHNFFAQHPANTSDDTPFRTAKTVLNELIKARGGAEVLQLLQSMDSISPSAFIYLLTSRLGGVNLTEQDTELHARVVSIIESITSARDKVGAIRELHQIRRAHPSLDINSYLQKISSAFRRFVVDTLARLDAAEGLSNNENSSPVAPSHTAASATSSSVVKPSAPASVAAAAPSAADVSSAGIASPSRPQLSNSKANEAMRILENLKNRPSYYKQQQQQQQQMHHISSAATTDSVEGANGTAVSPSHRNSSSLSGGLRRSSSEYKPSSAAAASDLSVDSEIPPMSASSPRINGRNLHSPFSRRNDNIRNSLSKLTASLDLPSGDASSGSASFDRDILTRMNSKLSNTPSK